MKTKGHSEEYFGDFRDHWYNWDFLELMAKRWEFENVKTLLDVGRGQCHWTRIVAALLNKGSSVTAVDSDPKWARENDKLREFFATREIGFEIQKADVLKLPFEDNSFDAVTCQTVLIHIENPLDALREMKRVLKPGGILICAEPNNLTACAVKDSVIADFDVEELADWFKFGVINEKGKIKLGLGDNSLGDQLPGMFYKIGLTDIKPFVSDKAIMINPPYQTPEMKSLLKFKIENDYEEFMKDQTKKQFRAFGDKYDSVLESGNVSYEVYRLKVKEEIQNQTYFEGGAALMYLVSGRK